MDKTEHLLQVLSEECAEVSKECSKALRFGLEDKVTMNPSGPRGTEGPTNREKISYEIADLFAIVEMLANKGILPRECMQRGSHWDHKQQRVVQYMGYAERVGALLGDGNPKKESEAGDE